MDYITSLLSPYRGNLNEEIWDILKEDHKRTCREIHSRGFLFLTAYIVVMFMSVLKVIVFILKHYQKPERPKYYEVN